MIPIYRRVYLSGPRALEATGKAVLIYDLPADATLSAWDAILISETISGVTLPSAFQFF